MPGIYDQGLEKNPANYAPLTPLTLLQQTGSVYPEKTALIYGDLRRDWGTTYRRCRQLASALVRAGVRRGDTVSVVAPNVPEMFEAHFGVPLSGAVLNTINYRLDADSIGFILGHAESRVVLVDREYGPVVKKALAAMTTRPLLITIDDPAFDGGEAIGEINYDQFLDSGDPDYDWQPPPDEWDAISLNYTSGTTGNPKGVVYHHRGALLNAVNNVLAWDMPRYPVYLWTLPMFHCNGWCFPWTLAAQAGTSVCLRYVRAETIFRLIEAETVSHLCAAPTVLNMLINAPETVRKRFGHPLRVMTAGAAPPAAIIQGMEHLGAEILHAYGLTETYGPAASCAWHEGWDRLPLDQRVTKKARPGVRYPILEGLMVADPATLQEVPHDGESMGEVMFRGNVVMKGYLKNPTATAEAFAGGWFRTGDLGVCHPDGYIQICDRAKDIIISGGENISSIELESVLYRHPAILEAAVVAKPDDNWGEVPCAFVALKPGMSLTETELIDWCRQRMAAFKLPKQVVFGDLPKTSTGKIQKFLLRQAM